MSYISNTPISYNCNILEISILSYHQGSHLCSTMHTVFDTWQLKWTLGFWGTCVYWLHKKVPKWMSKFCVRVTFWQTIMPCLPFDLQLVIQHNYEVQHSYDCMTTDGAFLKIYDPVFWKGTPIWQTRLGVPRPIDNRSYNRESWP